MKIDVAETLGDWDGLLSQQMKVVDDSGKEQSISVFPLCDCPEDAIIGRNLIGCGQIIDLMHWAYMEGSMGNGFTVEHVDWEDF